MVWFSASSVVDAGSDLGEVWGLGGSFYDSTNPSHADGSGGDASGGSGEGSGSVDAGAGGSGGSGEAGGGASGGSGGSDGSAAAGGTGAAAASDKTVFCTMHGGVGHRIHGDTCFQIADFCKGNAALNYGELWTAGDCASVGHTALVPYVDSHASAFQAYKKP